MEFFREEYWSGLPCPPLGDLPNPGIEPEFLHLLHWQAGSLPLAPAGSLSDRVLWAKFSGSDFFTPMLYYIQWADLVLGCIPF